MIVVNYLVIISLLRHQYPALAHVLTHLATFEPKLVFKNTCLPGFQRA